MVLQIDALERDGDHAGGTRDQLEAALIVAAVGGESSRAAILLGRVLHEGDVVSAQYALLAELEVQPASVVRPADVLVPHEVQAHGARAHARQVPDQQQWQS